MAGKIKIGIAPFVGEYDFGPEERSFSTVEWRWLKKIAGYYPLTLGEGFAKRDPDLFVAFAVIALYRAGAIQKEDAYRVAELFDDPPFDGDVITYIGGDAEEDPTLASPLPSESDSVEKTSDETPSSGSVSSESSEPSEDGQSPTGAHILEMPTSGLGSGQETLAS